MQSVLVNNSFSKIYVQYLNKFEFMKNINIFTTSIVMLTLSEHTVGIQTIYFGM